MIKQLKNIFLAFFGLNFMLFPIVSNSSGSSAMLTKEYKLENGLKIVVREDHRSPVIVSQVWYKVGSADEYNGVTGISHALEHMMFQGTEKIPGDGYSITISKNGGHDNAFTTEDYTGYYAELAADKLELSFELEADRMANLKILPKAFEQEKKVVIEERRMRTDDNPQHLTYERFMAVANPAGPYHHPTVGWMHDIENLTVEDLKTWYQNWYGPNNAIVVVVGDVVADDVFNLAKKHFGVLEPKALKQSKVFQELKPLGERRLTVKVPAKLPYLMMGYDVPSLLSVTKNNQKEVYALLVTSFALSGGESARFAKHLVRGKEIAASANGYYDPFKRYSTQFLLTGIPKDHVSLKQLETELMAQVDILKTELIQEKELQRIQNQLIASEIFEKDSMSEQATNIGAYESVGLSWRDADNFIENIKAVTAEDIQQAVKKYFVEDRLTVANLEPQAIS